MDPIASDINVNTALPWSLVTSIRKPSLDTMLEVSKAGQIQSDHPWLVAQQLLEEAEQTHHFLPILLVVSDGSDLKLSHWGGAWSTSRCFSCQRVVGRVGAESGA